MASYRPLHPPAPPPPPSQGILQPPPPPPPHVNQYQAYNQSYAQMNLSSNYQQHFNHPSGNQVPPPPQQQPFQYQPPPPPPPSESASYPPPPPPSESSSYPPPPPPSESSSYPPPPPSAIPPTYYPDSQFNQPQPLQAPPPPPPPSSPPPPPPPSQLPPPPPLPSARFSAESRHAGERPAHGNLEASSKEKQKPPLPPAGPVQRSGRHRQPGHVETEEERRLRKKREYEKLRQGAKMQHLKESQNKVLEKTQLATGVKGHGSISGSHMGDRRSAPLLSGDRIENRLKKPTTFVCKMKFWNELPDPSAKIKLLTLRRDPDRYVKYTITSLEKNHKPQLYVEPDLGIPLDLLDLSVYNPPKGERLPMDPEDEELLREDVPITPTKLDGIKRKARPTEKGVSWLVKTQYISPISMESTKQSLTEKQAKELRESRGGLNILDNLNNSRKAKIHNIEASFKACKSKPVHSTNRQLYPRRILPLIPYFDRYEDQFVLASFDSAPTADSETYSKLNAADREEHERCAIMKSYMASSSGADKPDKFLAYMVPSVGELNKDMYDENEDIAHSWIREYHWDVRGDNADDPTSYLVTFGDSEARYLPLPTKLVLRKKRAREGKSSEEVEQFPVPKRVTVRKRSQVSVRELKDEEDYEAPRGRFGANGRGVHHSDADDLADDHDNERDSGGEEDYVSE